MSEKKVYVSEQFIKQLQERNMNLEQQLKTAKADGVREAVSEVMRNLEISRRIEVSGPRRFPPTEFLADMNNFKVMAEKLIEYANNLEGK